MRNIHLTRIAVLSTAAAVCLGTAVPASAHSLGGSSGSGTKTTSAPTLAQEQAWIDSFIAKRKQQLAGFASKIAADPKLTDAQKADFAAKIAKQQAALSNLKSAVDAATSVAAVHQALRSAMTADGVHGFFGWCGFFGMHNWDGMHRDRDGRAPATAHQVSRVHHTDPKTTRTVAVTMASHAPTLQPDRTAGRHRSDAQHSWSSWSGQRTIWASHYSGGYSTGGYQARHRAGSYGGYHR
ncbi:MAG TPA: hypothetical protein VH298_16815 [Jatrophihabitans sp.]|nr:hypothetical protein [Jatrophihabitans sp.]